MTDSTATASASRELPLQPGATVDIHLTSGSLRVTGTDDDRVVVRPLDGDPLGDDVRIDGAPDGVHIRDGDMGWKVGPFSVATRRARDLAVDLPRTAVVALRTLSADVVATGIGGDSRWATASGDLRISVEGGRVQLETMSGDATLEATGTISLGARTVSGDLRIRAPRLDELVASTTSGDLRVEGDLGASSHTISSVSGDVEIVTGSPVRVAVDTITGDVNAIGHYRSEGARGHRTIVVGNGSVSVSVRTTSGDVRLRSVEPGSVPEEPKPTERQETSASAGTPVTPDRPSTPPMPVPPVGAVPPSAPVLPVAPVPPAVPPAPVSPIAPVMEATSADASAAEAPDEVPDEAPAPAPATAVADEPPLRPVDAEEDTHAWNAPGPIVDRREADRLEVLRALERGDLDIEAAARRLETLEQAGPRYFRGWC